MLLPRVLELYVAVLGTLKHRSVACTLFSAFGPEPIRERLSLGTARALVTTAALYERKVAGLRAALPHLRHVVIVDDGEPSADTIAWGPLLDSVPATYEIPPTSADDPALLHFTSGTTGTPKGALHVHEAVVAHHTTGRLALDLHPDDVFWCTADPGWVTGTSYGIVAPLTHGVTCIVDEGDFDADRWYRILQDQRVTVWYTAPTAIRRLMRLGPMSLTSTTCRGCGWRPASVSRFTPTESAGASRPSAGRSTTTGGRRRPAGSWWPTSRASRSDRARWAAPCRASRRPSCAATTKATSSTPRRMWTGSSW